MKYFFKLPLLNTISINGYLQRKNSIFRNDIDGNIAGSINPYRFSNVPKECYIDSLLRYS